FSPLRQLRASAAPAPPPQAQSTRFKVAPLLTNERAAACLCVLAYSELSATQAYAAGVLQEAAEASGADALPPAVQPDVVRAAVALIQSSEGRTQGATLAALAQLAGHDENRHLLIRGGVLQAAVPLARDATQPSVRAAAVALLRLLAMAEESRGVLG